MTTYFMFGKYSSEAIKGVSPERTKKANDIILKLGGEIVAQYGLLGYRDLVLIVNLPGVEEVFQASANLYKLTGVSFSSFPAITIEKFDEILTQKYWCNLSKEDMSFSNSMRITEQG